MHTSPNLDCLSREGREKAQTLFSMAACGSARAEEGQDEYTNENDDHRRNKDQDADPARHLQASVNIQASVCW